MKYRQSKPPESKHYSPAERWLLLAEASLDCASSQINGAWREYEAALQAWLEEEPVTDLRR